jgi:hypothetical protein
MSVRKSLIVIVCIVLLLYLTLLFCVHLFRGSTVYSLALKVPNGNSLFFLHSIGDYRYSYYKKDPLTITFYVPTSGDSTLHSESVASVSSQIVRIFPLHVKATAKTISYPPHSVWSNSDISSFVKKHRDGDISVFLINTLQGDDRKLGLSADYRSIVLFTDLINHNTLSNEDDISLKTLIITHELGHLLGMRTVEDQSCIMSSYYESLATSYYKPVIHPPFVPCSSDMSEFKQALL